MILGRNIFHNIKVINQSLTHNILCFYGTCSYIRINLSKLIKFIGKHMILASYEYLTNFLTYNMG